MLADVVGDHRLARHRVRGDRPVSDRTAMITAEPRTCRRRAFAFTPENLAKADELDRDYPPGRQASAVMPLLDLAQRQHGGWLPRAAMDHVAELLGMPPIRVYEVATFYTMFNLRAGRASTWCRSAPRRRAGCAARTTWSRACEDSSASASARRPPTAVHPARVRVPRRLRQRAGVQIDDDFYEDLDEAATQKRARGAERGETPKPGPQIGRQTSAPVGGPTTLLTCAE